MKYLVMSDNHGKWATVNQIIERERNKVDYIFHCGDSEIPADDPIWETVDLVVQGNMDFDPAYDRQETIETPGGRVFITHGHHHGVNFSNQHLLELAKSNHYDIVFHGHTHKLYAEYIEGVLICNPGSLNHSRGPIKATTYLIVDIKEDTYSCYFFNEEGERLVDLDCVFQR